MFQERLEFQQQLQQWLQLRVIFWLKLRLQQVQIQGQSQEEQGEEEEGEVGDVTDNNLNSTVDNLAANKLKQKKRLNLLKNKIGLN